MIVAIHQPNFLPWLGFFHKLLLSDVFVLFDNVQFSRGKSFTNRVSIKTANGINWLTVPVERKGLCLPIKDVKIANVESWKEKHLKTLWNNYKKASYFDEFFNEITKIYQVNHTNLASFNTDLIHLVAKVLDADTKIKKASDLIEDGGNGPELIDKIMTALGADKYLAGGGNGHKRYQEEIGNKDFEVVFQPFKHPEYKQLWGEFQENLSIIDLIFNHGKNSKEIVLNN